MKRALPFLVILALALHACAPAEASLWGQYQTPTSIVRPIEPPVDSLPTAVIPTSTPTESSLIEPLQPSPTFTPTLTLIPPTQPSGPTDTPDPQDALILYYVQSGDTLQALATRFGVSVSDITSPKDLPQSGFIDPGILLFIPRRITEPTTPGEHILPDAELIFSASSAEFNSSQFIANAGGYLSTFRQWVNSTGWMTGAQAVERASYENSISPRILLALLEYKARWIYGKPANTAAEDYPMAT